MNKNKIYSVAFCTLGCRVNQYETQAVSEIFQENGFRVQNFSDICDVYVINTCTVTAESDRKSRQMINKARTRNEKAIVVAMGCYTQIKPEEALLLGVDIVCGSRNKTEVFQQVSSLLNSGKEDIIDLVQDISEDIPYENMSITRSENTRAFVKICDGCENNCTYCIIPKARGKIRSRHICDIVSEIEALCANGYSEVVLTGIETASYGKDLENEDLLQLLRRVSEIDGVKRIRLGSLEPTVVTEEFAKCVAEKKKVCPHFHLSLQSGCDQTLFAMKRKYNTAMFVRATELLRKYVPDVLFTTDIIVGFPTETEEMFEKSRQFIKECRFLHLHVFPYSKREGTLAATFDDASDMTEKKRRVHILEKLEEEQRKSIFEYYNGKEAHVLLETKKDIVYSGYTENYIDVKVISEKDDLEGKIVPVKLKYENGNYLYMTGIMQ